MSFFFANQSKKILKKNLGHPKINVLSLQLYKPTTIKKPIYVSETSFIVSPAIIDSITVIFRKAKRTFLSTHLKGSITVEASIVLPLFIFTLISIIYFFNLIFIQINMQIQLENVAKSINASTCITTGMDVNLSDSENSLMENVIIDAAGTIAINTLFINEDIKSFADNTLIVNGSEGLSFLGSDVTNTDYPLKLLLSYKVRMPFIPEDIFTFNITHQCYFKAFNGKKLAKTVLENVFFVYVTEDGEYYHTGKMCSHLARYTFIENLDTLKKNYPDIRQCSFCNKHNNLISKSSDRGPYICIRYF